MSATPIPGPVVIEFAEQCDRGTVRKENQDSVRHLCLPLGELIIVADGIGGYQGGAVASRLAVEQFGLSLAALPAGYPPDKAIREASARANAEIVAAADTPGSPYNRMGSTVVLALLQGGPNPVDPEATSQNRVQCRAWIGHIGDSRAYLFRAGRLNRITSDHSAVQALINRNIITPEEARHHPDASVLTRSLGHYAQVEIDLEMLELETGDTLLLCSDGLWGYVEEQQIETILANPSLTLQAASQALLALALAAGGHDNIGIELARLNPAPAQAPILPQNRSRLLPVLALCLLLLAAMGALLSLALRHHWLHFLHH